MFVIVYIHERAGFFQGAYLTCNIQKLGVAWEQGYWGHTSIDNIGPLKFPIRLDNQMGVHGHGLVLDYLNNSEKIIKLTIMAI